MLAGSIGQCFVPLQRRKSVSRPFPVNGLEQLLLRNFRLGLGYRRVSAATSKVFEKVVINSPEF
jgi:hypothetical protein